MRLAEEAAIALVDGPIDHIGIEGSSLCLSTSVGHRAFASAYLALGSIIRSELSRSVGADVSDEGCLLVDAHQRTTCKGFYMASDVVIGLDQNKPCHGRGRRCRDHYLQRSRQHPAALRPPRLTFRAGR